MPLAAEPGSRPRPGAGREPRGAATPVLALALCLAASAALRAPAMGLPIDRDSAVYAVIGRELASGALPYRDLIDHKQPVIYPVYSALEAVAPASATAIHVASAVVGGFAAWLLFLLLRRHVGDRVAAGAAALATIVGASRYVEGFALNTEHVLLVTGTIPILLALARPAGGGRAVAALIGATCAVAVLTKAVAALLLPAVLTAMLMRRSARERARDVVAALAGGAAVLGILIAVYAAGGGVGDLLAWNLTYNADYAAQLSAGERLDRLRMYPADLLLVAVAAGAAAALLRRRGRRDVLAVTLTVWLAGAAAGAVVGGFGYAHYYAPVVLPAAALLTVAVAAARPGRGRAVALLAAVLAIAPFAADHVRALAGGGDALADRSYGEQAQVWRMYEPVGALLRERARPGDRLYVTGNEAGFYWQSRLRPASPLLYEAPLTVRPELGEELRRALCGRPPRFLVLSAGAAPAAAPCLAGAGYVVVARRPPAIVVLDRGR